MPLILERTSTRLAAGLGLAGMLAVSSSVAVGIAALAPTEARAQGFFNAWDWPPPRKIQRAKKARAIPAAPATKSAQAEPETHPTGPLVINVSIKTQRVTVYDANGIVAEAPVSTGRVGYPTPTGVFTVIEKDKIHYSNLYESAPMPNMQRITQSGVALHAGPLPGYPASHGCIRLPYGFSQKLFGMTRLGTRVIVSRDPASPVPIAHERLFTALPPENELSTAASVMFSAGAQVADASNSTVGSSTGLASPGLPPDLGVAGAAEGQAQPGEAKKPSFREVWKAEMARLAEAVTTAESEKAAAASRIAEAAQASEFAIAAVKQAKAQAARLAQGAKKARDAKEAAEREFAGFAKKIVASRDMPEDALRKAAETEDTLEAKAYGLGDAAEAAQKDAALGALAVEGAEAAAIEAAKMKRSAMANAGKANASLAAAIAADEAGKRRDAKRPLPVSIFVSRATQRLYVRQGYEPIFDAPVIVDSADQPIGTHVFTALDYKASKTEMIWSVASIAYTGPAKAEAKKTRDGKNAKGEAKPIAPPAEFGAPQTPAAALARVTIPEEVRDQIADIMKPGSSLVISDHGISKETGKHTDFIVLTR